MRSLPPDSVLQRGSVLISTFLGRSCRVAIAASTVAICSSCAKFPANPTGQHTRLIFTMTVAGHIRNGPTESGNYIYMVALYPSTDPNPPNPPIKGPIPVIGPPWGNGFVAGDCVYFVRYDYTQTSPYLIYKFANPEDLIVYGPTGVPVVTEAPPQGGATLRFELDMSQIDTTNGNPDSLQSVKVNFLTMNRIPQGGDTGAKYWDALGNGQNPNEVNDSITIRLDSSHVYSNAGPEYIDIEPQGDVPDPDLDIINWSVEVRKP